jgi:protein-S-isoprenylcysteine O-methyltransferase Ste14
MAGFAVLAVGSLLHFVVKGVLIRNSVLCKDGIYSVVRHPYYLANYIIDSSFCLITGNMYLVFMYPFLFGSSQESVGEKGV